MSDDSLYYASVYAKSTLSVVELQRLIADVVSGDCTGIADVRSNDLDIPVCKNPDIHGRDYFAFPYLIEVQPTGEALTRESAAKSLSLLLQGLWDAGVTTVTEYMFEQDLPHAGRNDGKNW